MTDKEIIALYLERSERAISETRAQYGGLVRHVIRCILSNALDIEECENDTYLGAWQSIPPNQPHSLGAYLSRIARNTACKRLEYLTAGKRSAALLPIEELAEVLADGRADNCTDAELSELINGFLASLKPDVRRVFLMRYWMSLSVREIGGRTGFSKSKIETMLHRTRNRLRDELRRKGYCYDK